MRQQALQINNQAANVPSLLSHRAKLAHLTRRAQSRLLADPSASNAPTVGLTGEDARLQAIRARIQKAKQYKESSSIPVGANDSFMATEPTQPDQSSQGTGTPTSPPANTYNAVRTTEYAEEEPTSQSSAPPPGFEKWLQPEDPISAPPYSEPKQPYRKDFYENSITDVRQLLEISPTKQGYGSATQPAAWLQGVLGEDGGRLTAGIDPNQRMEEFTRQKEERVKELGAEIITANIEYNPQGSGKYKPTVSTWGVFPRPENISAAYGGGRNIKPGQELETPEQKLAREQAYTEALQKYKKAIGFVDLDVDLETEAMDLYKEGMELFNKGLLRESYKIFDKVLTRVPLKSKAGGLAALQKAIVLDSLGSSKDAEKIYRQIKGHPLSAVSKKAKQMLFGFEAMDFLKAHQFSYGVKKEEYSKYFRNLADRNQIYVGSEEDRARDAELERLSTAVAVAVVVFPILLVVGVAHNH